MLWKAFWVVLFIRIALKTFSYKRVLDHIENSTRHGQTAKNYDIYEKHAIRAVRAVARRSLGNKPCLPQALALKWLLGRAGKTTNLQIGVSKNTSKEIEAHAWLELDGEIIIGGRSSPIYYEKFRSSQSHN